MISRLRQFWKPKEERYFPRDVKHMKSQYSSRIYKWFTLATKRNNLLPGKLKGTNRLTTALVIRVSRVPKTLSLEWFLLVSLPDLKKKLTKKSKYYKKKNKTRGKLHHPFKIHMKVNRKSNSNKLSKNKRERSNCSFRALKYLDKKSGRQYLSLETESIWLKLI